VKLLPDAIDPGVIYLLPEGRFENDIHFQKPGPPSVGKRFTFDTRINSERPQDNFLRPLLVSNGLH
jgi:hypothetical protein